MINKIADCWTSYNPVEIISGPGVLSRVRDLSSSTGKILLVTTKGFTKRGVTQRALELLPGERTTVWDEVTPNPEIDELDSIAEEYKKYGISLIIAIGGGSVLDAAKVLSVTIPNGKSKVLAESFRGKKPFEWSSRIPVIAVPTTAGTGAEVTPFATIWDKAERKKYSLAGEHVFPRWALLDPELTLNLPPDQTLYTGLDAISHSLESLWNKNRNSITETYAFKSLELAIDALPKVLKSPNDLKGRLDMQLASTLAGMAISSTRTAIAHSISYPLTIHHGVPHGLACSFTLPSILSGCIKELSRSDHQARLLATTLQLLKELKLFGEIQKYVSIEDILRLKDEMNTVGRADNFLFEVKLDSYLHEKN